MIILLCSVHFCFVHCSFPALLLLAPIITALLLRSVPPFLRFRLTREGAVIATARGEVGQGGRGRRARVSAGRRNAHVRLVHADRERIAEAQASGNNSEGRSSTAHVSFRFSVPAVTSEETQRSMPAEQRAPRVAVREASFLPAARCLLCSLSQTAAACPSTLHGRTRSHCRRGLWSLGERHRLCFCKLL